MAGNFGSPNPIQPLSVGNVVSAGVRLYRSRLKPYFLLALVASLWSFLPILFFIPAAIVTVWNIRFNANSPLVWLILVVIGIIITLYALGKYLVNSAIISRLAFGELVDQLETVQAARAQVKSRLWTFVLTSLLLFVIFFIIFFILFLFWSIFSAFILASQGVETVNPVGLIISILMLLLLSTVVLWFMAKFFIADVLIAIEDNLDPVTTVSRSWELSQNNAWRILLIIFVAGLITIPIQLIIQLLVQNTSQAIYARTMPDVINGSISAISTVVIVYLMTLIIALLVSAVFIPFWQSIKAVIYYDLRSRREGLGLKLRDNEI
ncbi:MAG TPA: hypothetical protein V6D25_21320 [Leptolyngbyaceae cyanobacterium]